MLGLVSCSIIVQLKANLISTLAALGKSSETAIQLWNLLETSQIITTVPTTSNFASRGIESELEEIESRNETYPLTRAILDLLYSLSSVIVPKSLGAGPRKPGLDPYINFVIETVFLKFYNRNYKDPQEKWEVAEKCLQICEMFMKMYIVSPKDFPSSMNYREENSQPGFHIMLLLHTKSEFLRLILHLIDESCLMLETYSPFEGKKSMENLTLKAVNILEMALSKQDQFFEAHFASNSSLLLSGLNKLILDINPRSGRNDHMLNIAKLVTFNSSLPYQALAAVKILRHVIRQPNVNNQILGVFTSNDRLKLEIRQGFVECLENESDDPVEIELKEEILVLLADSLPHAAPNLAHYLIGFDISKDIRMSNLQQPGILDFPSNCAKSLVMLLDQNLEILKRSQLPPENTQKLVENAYSLLYQLCFNIKTSEVFLRYLRSCGDFLARHTSELPFFNPNNNFHVLNQMTGLLKCVAIELKLTAEKNQLSQFGNLCKILLGVAQNVTNTTETFQIELAHYGNVNKKLNKKLLICELLNCLDFEYKPLDNPKFEYFDASLMSELFKSCESSFNSAGVKLIDVKKIHAILKEELNSVQSTIAAGQRQFIVQEIESIMEHALNLNNNKLSTNANVKFLDAWSQVTEITFSVHPTFFFTPDSRQALITEILQALLKYVVPGQVSQVAPELANSASSTVLLLMMNLRTCFGKKTPNEPSQSFFGNQSSLNLSQDQITTVSSPRSNMKYIFKNIIEWIIVSGVGSQKLRMNLYSALLNFMYIVKGECQVKFKKFKFLI
jgi:nuclear pore complex protein Nup205